MKIVFNLEGELHGVIKKHFDYFFIYFFYVIISLGDFMKYVVSVIVIILLGLGIFVYINSNPKVKEISIKKLNFSYSSNNMMYGYTRYELDCSDKCMATIKPYGESEEDTITVEVKESDVLELEKSLNKYEVNKWDGFDKIDKNVLDGNNFSFSLTTKNAEEISAHGYMKYPKNYGEVRGLLDSFFEKYYKE